MSHHTLWSQSFFWEVLGTGVSSGQDSSLDLCDVMRLNIHTKVAGVVVRLENQPAPSGDENVASVASHLHPRVPLLSVFSCESPQVLSNLIRLCFLFYLSSHSYPLPSALEGGGRSPAC